MFWLKNCPRCHGDLNENTDIYGNYISCFQCGHYLTANEEGCVREGNPFGKNFTSSAGRPVKVLTGIAA